jgi:hypothetical protein
VQLFALTPGLGPNFRGFRSLKGLLNPIPFQSRRTRFRLSDQPRRINMAWILR